MKVLILTWEFPPRVVGDIAMSLNRQVAGLAKKKVDVNVFTFDDWGIRLEKNTDGVVIHRLRNPVETHVHIITWALTFSTELQRVISELMYDLRGNIDLIDAHEWLTIDAAIALREAFGIPFIYTIYSLEKNRSLGAMKPFNMAIDGIETNGCREADGIIIRSEWMREEVSTIPNVFRSKVHLARPESPFWIDNILDAYRSVLPNSGGTSRN